MSVLPLTQFNQCINALIQTPNSKQFHEAVTMLDTAFKAKTLDKENKYIVSVYINEIKQPSPLKPLVERLSEAYENASKANVVYEKTDTDILQIFIEATQNTINPVPDYCTTVSKIFSWLFGVKDKSI